MRPLNERPHEEYRDEVELVESDEVFEGMRYVKITACQEFSLQVASGDGLGLRCIEVLYDPDLFAHLQFRLLTDVQALRDARS